jgi:hypothetical protein
MRADRLLLLAERLEQIADDSQHPRKFDMMVWYEDLPTPQRNVGQRILDFFRRKIDCKTAACAFGEACLMPEFQQEGLKLGRTSSGDYLPAYDGFITFEAAAKFFDIGGTKAITLFSPDSYVGGKPSPREVAFRIRELVANQ